MTDGNTPARRTAKKTVARKTTTRRARDVSLDLTTDPPTATVLVEEPVEVTVVPATPEHAPVPPAGTALVQHATDLRDALAAWDGRNPLDPADPVARRAAHDALDAAERLMTAAQAHWDRTVTELAGWDARRQAYTDRILGRAEKLTAGDRYGVQDHGSITAR